MVKILLLCITVIFAGCADHSFYKEDNYKLDEQFTWDLIVASDMQFDSRTLEKIDELKIYEDCFFSKFMGYRGCRLICDLNDKLLVKNIILAARENIPLEISKIPQGVKYRVLMFDDKGKRYAAFSFIPFTLKGKEYVRIREPDSIHYNQKLNIIMHNLKIY
ncbi:MAG TPA: hypothetical protein VGK71_01365 [Nitrospirota bacterium]|jgi:hypothetical protein